MLLPALAGLLRDGVTIHAGGFGLLGWSLARDLAGDEAAKPVAEQARWKALVPPG